MRSNRQSASDFVVLDIKHFAKERLRVLFQEILNTLMKEELTFFLQYEPWDFSGYNTGNSRNGYYGRFPYSRLGQLSLKKPCDRNREFEQKTIPPYGQNLDALENAYLSMFKKDIAIHEIAALLEPVYEDNYTYEETLRFAKKIAPLIKEVHTRPLSSKYALVYISVTNVYIDSILSADHSFYTVVGITPDGNKEILDYRLYHDESSENIIEILQSLKDRGVNDITQLMFSGHENAKNEVHCFYPAAKYRYLNKE